MRVELFGTVSAATFAKTFEHRIGPVAWKRKQRLGEFVADERSTRKLYDGNKDVLVAEPPPAGESWTRAKREVWHPVGPFFIRAENETTNLNEERGLKLHQVLTNQVKRRVRAIVRQWFPPTKQDVASAFVEMLNGAFPVERTKPKVAPVRPLHEAPQSAHHARVAKAARA